jgi:hypothetical protein
MEIKPENLVKLNEETTKSLESMYIFNDNLRKNIELSLLIYKKLNNFNYNYIHSIFDDDNFKSSK